MTGQTQPLQIVVWLRQYPNHKQEKKFVNCVQIISEIESFLSQRVWNSYCNSMDVKNAPYSE